MTPHNGNSRQIETTPGQVDGDDDQLDQSVSSLARKRFMPPTDGFDELALMRCRGECGWSSSTATSSSRRSRIRTRQELQPCVASCSTLGAAPVGRGEKWRVSSVVSVSRLPGLVPHSTPHDFQVTPLQAWKSGRRSPSVVIHSHPCSMAMAAKEGVGNQVLASTRPR